MTRLGLRRVTSGYAEAGKARNPRISWESHEGYVGYEGYHTSQRLAGLLAETFYAAKSLDPISHVTYVTFGKSRRNRPRNRPRNPFGFHVTLCGSTRPRASSASSSYCDAANRLSPSGEATL